MTLGSWIGSTTLLQLLRQSPSRDIVPVRAELSVQANPSRGFMFCCTTGFRCLWHSGQAWVVCSFFVAFPTCDPGLLTAGRPGLYIYIYIYTRRFENDGWDVYLAGTRTIARLRTSRSDGRRGSTSTATCGCRRRSSRYVVVSHGLVVVSRGRHARKFGDPLVRPAS